MNDDFTAQKEPTIRRGRVDSLVLYEITDHELDVLEQGSPGSTELNFAVALLSIAASILSTLLTATFASDRVFFSFILATIGSGVLGTYFLIKWLRTSNDVKIVIRKIKARVPDEGAEDSATPPKALHEARRIGHLAGQTGTTASKANVAKPSSDDDGDQQAG